MKIGSAGSLAVSDIIIVVVNGVETDRTGSINKRFAGLLSLGCWVHGKFGQLGISIENFIPPPPKFFKDSF